MLWLACLTAVRNQRTLAAYHLREQDNDRRAAAGLPPRTRKRRAPSPAPARTTTITGPHPSTTTPAATHQQHQRPATTP